MAWELDFMRWANGWWSSSVLDQVLPWLTYLGSHFAVIFFILLGWILTHSTASCPPFKGGVKKRGSGSALSKSWLLFRQSRHLLSHLERGRGAGGGVEGLTKQRRVLRHLIFLYAIQSAIIYSLKFLIQRQRPFLFLEMASKLSRGPGEILDPSFPSAHAAFSFMMATLLSIWFPRYQIIFYIAAASIGWTRIYLALHYPTDVIAGALLGYACTKLFIRCTGGLRIEAHH